MLLPDGAEVERLAGGATWSEGAVWVSGGTNGAPAGTGEVWWSDIPGNRVLGWSWDTGTTRVVVADAEFANGRTLGLAGEVLQCSHGRRLVERLVDDRTPTGRVETLVDRCYGVRFNSPNDVVVRSDGSVWFTDPPYGLIQPAEGHGGEQEYQGCHVFRVGLDGALSAVVTDIQHPNGLAFSPDESLLYVTDTSRAVAGHGDGHHIRVHDVVGDTCSPGRVFAVVEPGVPDGLRVDELGNVWTSTGDGVQVLSPDGEPLVHVPVPGPVGNLCFGGPDGRTLFVVACEALFRLRTGVRDAAAVLRARSAGEQEGTP